MSASTSQRIEACRGELRTVGVSKASISFSVTIIGAIYWKDGEVYEDWSIGKSSNSLLYHKHYYTSSVRLSKP